MGTDNTKSRPPKRSMFWTITMLVVIAAFTYWSKSGKESAPSGDENNSAVVEPKITKPLKPPAEPQEVDDDHGSSTASEVAKTRPSAEKNARPTAKTDHSTPKKTSSAVATNTTSKNSSRPVTTTAPPKTFPEASDTKSSTTKPIEIQNVVIKNEDGEVVYRGAINLQPTLDRIEAGKRLSFPHDGTVFQNREGRLPRRESGHYREWVHPTSGLSGPGPQRVVTGEDGERYYTHDHYRTFRRLPDSP